MSHLFFCSNASCSATVDIMNSICMNCWRASTTFPAPLAACPDCGDTGASSVGTDRCAACQTHHDHPCNRAVMLDDHEHPGNCAWNDDGTRTCDDDEVEWSIWCVAAPRCTCDGSGRMCPHCCEEDSDPCYGCGSHSLWDNRYCLACYEDRYGPRNLNPVPMCIDCGGHQLAQGSARCYSCIDGARSAAYADVPPGRSPDELREVIAEIEARLLTNMTKGQRDDWIWILQNRRADLAEAEKEMWEGYDQDDLRKLDRMSRY